MKNATVAEQYKNKNRANTKTLEYSTTGYVVENMFCVNINAMHIDDIAFIIMPFKYQPNHNVNDLQPPIFRSS